MRRGPIAVLLLLVGLVLGSAGGTGAARAQGPVSEAGQTRASKAAVAPRTPPRDLATPGEDDGGDPFLLFPRAPIVEDRAEMHPAPPAPPTAGAPARRPNLSGYRARAPPAA